MKRQLLLHKLKKILVLGLLLQMSTHVLGQTVLTLQPGAEGKDAVTEDRNKLKNSGNDSRFVASATGPGGGITTIKRSYLEFALSSIPADAMIMEAKLSLYASGEHSNNYFKVNTSILRRVTATWEENTITWNNQPTTTNEGQLELPFSNSNSQDYTDIDVTEFVKDMMIAGNHGFMMRLKTEDKNRRLAFYSSDIVTANKRPKLVVKYYPECTTVAVTTGLNTVLAKEDELTIGWTDNSNNEVGFMVFRSETETGDYQMLGIVPTNTTQYTDNKDQASGTNYYYKVRTLDLTCYSSFSNSLTATTTGPLTPSNITIVPYGSTSAIFSWTDNATNETGFEIERSLNSSTGFTNIGTMGADVITYTDEGLTPGTVYYYRVRAINTTGNSQYSTIGSVLANSVIFGDINIDKCDYYLLDPGGMGNYPNNFNKTIVLTSSEVGKKVKLDFEDFSVWRSDELYIYDGTTTSSPFIGRYTFGYGIKGKIIYAKGTSGALTLRFTTNGNTTRAGIKAHVTCIEIPNAPSEPWLKVVKSDSITINWVDNSANETGFEIFRSTTATGTYVRVGTVDPNVVQFTNRGLSSGTSYHYKVRAINLEGSSNFTIILSTTTKGPITPLNLAVKHTSISSAILTWEDKSGNETGFDVERSLQEISGFTKVATASANAITYTDNGLSANTTYYYRVRAINVEGESQYTATVYIQTSIFTMGDAPMVGCGYYLLDPGGEENYTNGLDKTMVLQPSELGKKLILTFESFTLAKNDTLYIFDGALSSAPLLAKYSGTVIPALVQAGNSGGMLALQLKTDAATVAKGFKIHVNCAIIPDAPTALTQDAAWEDSISISWTDNSANETNFTIFRSLTENGTFISVGTVSSDITQFTDRGLSSGTNYFYKVKADGPEESSGFSNVLSTLTTGPKSPSNLTVLSDNNGSAILSWSDNSNNETNFEIERSLQSNTGFAQVQTVSSDEVTYTNSSLTENTTYYYRVRAINAEGESQYTTTESVHIILCNVPESPVSSIVLGDILDESITLESYTGDADGYVIYISYNENDFTAPTDGTTPTANTAWQNLDKPQCVYLSTLTNPNVTVSGLNTSCSTYYFKVYAYNVCSGANQYETTGAGISAGGDIQNPVITCINNQTKEIASNETIYTVSGTEYNPALTGDNCNVYSIENDFNNTATLNGAKLPTGTTTVTWTVTDATGNTAQCNFDVMVSKSTGVRNLDKTGISVYPNPVDKILNLTSGKDNIQRIIIFNIIGKPIVEKVNINKTEQFDMSSYTSGVYFISIYTNDDVYTSRIIKK